MLTTTELWRPKVSGLFNLLAFANVGFAFLIVFVWAVAQLVIADPIAWATLAPIDRQNYLSLFTYPINLLWMLPVVAVCVGWSARKSRKERTAIGILLMPILFFSLMIGTYHVLGIYQLR
jgi:hypothetical protein